MVQRSGVLVVATNIVHGRYASRVAGRQFLGNDIAAIQLYISLETTEDPLDWFQGHHSCGRIEATCDQGVNPCVCSNVDNNLRLGSQLAPDLERCSFISIAKPVPKEIVFHHVAPVFKPKMVDRINSYGKCAPKTKVRGKTSWQWDSS